MDDLIFLFKVWPKIYLQLHYYLKSFIIKSLEVIEHFGSVRLEQLCCARSTITKMIKFVSIRSALLINSAMEIMSYMDALSSQFCIPLKCTCGDVNSK